MLHANQGETQYDETGRISLPGCTTAGRLPVQDGDDSGGTAGASLQFVHEVVDREVPGGQEVSVGEVLQAPDVVPPQHLVGLELSGLAPVSAGSVDAEARDIPLVHQPLGRLGRNPGEVEVLGVVLRQTQSLRPAEIFPWLTVVSAPPGVEDHDGGLRDGSVLLLPLLEVQDGQHRVRLGFRPGLDQTGLIWC